MCAAGIGALRGLSPAGGAGSVALALMRWLDKQYLATPFYGSWRMAAELRKAGHQVNRKRVRRLMRPMGLEALGPKPKTSSQHRLDPCLLRDLTIDRPNQVWAANITPAFVLCPASLARAWAGPGNRGSQAGAIVIGDEGVEKGIAFGVVVEAAVVGGTIRREAVEVLAEAAVEAFDQTTITRHPRRSRKMRENTSLASMSAVSMPRPRTWASNRTIRWAPLSGCGSSRRRRAVSISRICSASRRNRAISRRSSANVVGRHRLPSGVRSRSSRSA
jgi:HTH-like domain